MPLDHQKRHFCPTNHLENNSIKRLQLTIYFFGIYTISWFQSPVIAWLSVISDGEVYLFLQSIQHVCHNTSHITLLMSIAATIYNHWIVAQELDCFAPNFSTLQVEGWLNRILSLAYVELKKGLNEFSTCFYFIYLIGLHGSQLSCSHA